MSRGMEAMKTRVRHAVAALAILALGAAKVLAVDHRFLAVDESRAQLHLVDQRNTNQSWTLKLPERCRDYQLIGNNELLLSSTTGYYVYSLTNRALLKQLHNQRFEGAASVRRLADGRTLLGCNQNGITLFELGPDDAVLRTAKFPELNTLRLMRLSPTGTLLFGANGNLVVEADLAGKELARFTLPEPAKHVYQILRLPNGNLLAAAGYGHFLAEIDPTGRIVKRIDGSSQPSETHPNFWCGYQVLKNGNIVMCNWTGHDAGDSTKAPQVIEFDFTGRLVWSWHNPTLAGTVHGVVVLDDLDTTVLNDDSSGTLTKVATGRL
jgi:hypothetical protein